MDDHQAEVLQEVRKNGRQGSKVARPVRSSHMKDGMTLSLGTDGMMIEPGEGLGRGVGALVRVIVDTIGGGRGGVGGRNNIDHRGIGEGHLHDCLMPLRGT